MKRVLLTEAQILPLRLIAERRKRIVDDMADAEESIVSAYAAQAGIDGDVEIEQDEGGIWIVEKEINDGG